MTIEFPGLLEYDDKMSVEVFKESVYQICSLKFRLLSFRVQSEEDCLALLDLYKTAKDLYDFIDNERKRLGKPHREILNRINDLAKVLTTSLDESIALINQMREAFEQSEIKRLEQAKIEAKEQSEALGMDLSIYMPESPKKLVSEHATTMTKEIRLYKVTDEALVPREYLIVDPVAIKKAINMGIREIPGIEITVEKKTTIRRR
jgi:hypothetical protein